MSAIEDIAAERDRQRKVLGWTLAHDDEHTDSSLAAAASCYAFYGSLRDADRPAHEDLDNQAGFVSLLRFLWPQSWLRQHWKPKDRRTDLVRAGALIVAEIERLDRAARKRVCSKRRGQMEGKVR